MFCFTWLDAFSGAYDSESLGDKDDLSLCKTQNNQTLSIKRGEQSAKYRRCQYNSQMLWQHHVTKLEGFPTMDKNINKVSFPFNTHHL